MAVTRQISVQLNNHRGALAELCSELAKVAVNILALSVPEVNGQGSVRLVTNSNDAAKKVFDRLGLKYHEEDVIAAHVSDRPGALGRLTRKLADQQIDISYAYGSIIKDSGKEALIILAVSDVAAAARVVK
jgi:hypothetical protein